jgi:hypothetical protein
MTGMHHNLTRDELLYHRFMDDLSQILSGELSKCSAKGGLTGNLFHAAEGTQSRALLERFDELTGAYQIQNRFCQQGSCQGSSVDLLSATACFGGHGDFLFDAHDLQNLY